MDEENVIPVGPLLDNLGVVGPIEDNETITDAVVFAKVVNYETGKVTIGLYLSPDSDFITTAGLMQLGREVYDNVPFSDSETDGD